MFQCNVHAKSLQSCPTLCDPMNCGLPHSSVRGILQARILECVVISSSKGLFQIQDRTRSPALAGGFFTTRATQSHLKFAVRVWVWGLVFLPPELIFGSLLQDLITVLYLSKATGLISCPNQPVLIPHECRSVALPTAQPAVTRCPSPQLLLCSAFGGHPSPLWATWHIFFQEFVCVCKIRFTASYQNHNTTI